MKVKLPVFEWKPREKVLCRIFDSGDCYELESIGRTAQFSKDAAALDNVIATIEQYGNPRCNGRGREGFFFTTRNEDGKVYSPVRLSRVVFAGYTKKPISDYQGRRLNYTDGDEFNLLLENVSLVSDSRVDIINKDGKKYIRIIAGGEAVITDYYPDLHKIIKGETWAYKKEKRAMVSHDGKRGAYYLHQLIMAYHERGITATTWRDVVAKMYENPALTADHKRSAKVGMARWDNRLCNLQLTTRSLNGAKGNCTSNLPDDCLYLPKPTGERYGRYDFTDNTVTVHDRTGPASNENVAELKCFCKTRTFAEGAAINTFPLASEEGVKILLDERNEDKLYIAVLETALLLANDKSKK